MTMTKGREKVKMKRRMSERERERQRVGERKETEQVCSFELWVTAGFDC
jgi:hypothetical protein